MPYSESGGGSLVLTDAKVNRSDLFDDCSEVVRYESADKPVVRARHDLEHEDERRAIAPAGELASILEERLS